MSVQTSTTLFDKHHTSTQNNTLHRYKFLFDHSPIPIQETNVSNIATAIKRLKSEGVTNIKSYIQQHPNFIKNLFFSSNIFDVNDAMLQLTEAQSKDFYFRNFKEIMGEPCLNFFTQMIISLFNGETKLTEETELITFKGKKVWVEVTGIYFSENGEEFINYTFKDITERKFKSQAISTINERLVKGSYQEHLNNLVLALAEAFDLPYVFIGCANSKNKSIISTLALSVHNQIHENVTYVLEGTPCEDLYNTKKRVIFTNHLDKIFSENAMIQAWQGKSYLGYPLFSKNGEMIGHFGLVNTKPIEHLDTLQDIMELYATWASNEIERLSYQEALRDSENTLANVLDNTGDILLAFDTNLNVIAFNKEAKKEFKDLVDKDLEIGKNMQEFLEVFSQDAFNDRLEVYKQVFDGNHIVKERAFKQGEISRFFITSYRPMIDQNGEIIGCVTVARDRSNLRTAKKRLEIQNATIQKQLETLDNKNKELEKYIESNMQLENFAYIASHDLKAPIRTIVSFSQLLKRRLKNQLDENAQEYLDFIISSSRNMKQLIEDLLTYSRINTEAIIKKEVNVPYLIDAIVYEIQSNIKEKQATIQYTNLPDNLTGDYTKLKQLFQNLITNGIKFHKNGEAPTIQIKGEELDTEWCFSVSDNGIGIESDYFERIFILFQKLHTNSQYEGTGLGLAICKKIVELHNGRIWVDSTLNEGATFYFTIAK